MYKSFSVSEENSKSMGLYYFHDQDHNESFQWLFGSVPFSTQPTECSPHLLCSFSLQCMCYPAGQRDVKSPSSNSSPHTTFQRFSHILTCTHTYLHTSMHRGSRAHHVQVQNPVFAFHTIVIETFNVTFVLITEAFQISVRLSQRVLRLLFQVAHQRAEETQSK